MENPKSKPAAMQVKPKGAQVQSKESFLYGRFETMMCPAFGSGIVSSFFTFNDKPDFKKNWAEIDFEFLGRHTNCLDMNIIRTSDKGYTDKNSNVKKKTLPHPGAHKFWKLCIDWTPEYIVWKVNDEVVRSEKISLSIPQKLMMNIWVGSEPWAGEFNGGLLPQVADYEYVRYSSYDPTKKTFELKWQDSFKEFSESRWQIATHLLETTQLVKENVSITSDDRLRLRLA